MPTTARMPWPTSIPLHASLVNATTETLVGLMAAGYAGTDFTEGLIR